MKIKLKINEFFKSLKNKSLKIYYDNNSISDECALANIQRLHYLSVIAIPLRIFIILTFNRSYDNLLMKTWSQGIIISHLVLLVLMIGFCITTYKLKDKKEATTSINLLQYIAMAVIMLSGVVIVTFDQLVTTSITPFLITCIVTGLVFLIRPLYSLIFYILSYILYYNLITLTISNNQILISNRVNGITSVGLGFLLSFILWKYNKTNITQRKLIESQQKQLEIIAYYDPLTDLPNRRLLDKFIKQELNSEDYKGHESVVIILDIDDFKEINDSYGHMIGDNILVQFSALLKENIRKSDIAFRFGGEEFIIIMSNTNLETGYLIAERLRKLIMNYKFNIGSRLIDITASFGVALLNRVSGDNIENYYSYADRALYLAKEAGKNRVEIFEI